MEVGNLIGIVEKKEHGGALLWMLCFRVIDFFRSILEKY